MVQPRQPRGVPAGGQFAAQRHSEASGTLNPSDGFKSLVDLRSDSIDQVGHALRDLADNHAVDVQRHFDASFPTESYTDAVHALRSFHAALSGDPEPERPSRVDDLIAAYRGRVEAINNQATWEPGARSLAELQSDTAAAVQEAKGHLLASDVSELSRADAQFPDVDYGRAIQALEALGSRCVVPPLRPFSPDEKARITASVSQDERYGTYRPVERPAAFAPAPPPRMREVQKLG